MEIIYDRDPLKNFIIKQLSRFIKAFDKKIELQNSLLSTLSNNSIWIYSLMKSGTTYTALFLSNYFNYLYGDKRGVDFDRMNKEYCVHSLEGKLKPEMLQKMLNENLFFNNKFNDYNGLFTTHVPIKGDLWNKNISLYRNPLDFIISSYFFHYINRGQEISHPREIIKEKIKNFSKTIISQKAIKKKYSNKVYRLSYEELMKKPEQTFTKMINFLELESDLNAIAFAMEYSSKKKVKEMEKKRGEAIVKQDGVNFSGSFVRSGKIGEWKEYFDDEDLKRIDHEMHKYDLSLNEFVLE